ncbi:Pr6Pr family membrane protein [Gryllotalpicola koreensis]|uniref:Pr6Pr family membrane protein n=1 Tax=Gryllotalpicola koreensis TaxID=993086 RepID=A0ABP7ZQR0_9MICO
MASGAVLVPSRVRVWAGVRAVVALLIVAAIVTQAVVTIGGAVSDGRDVSTTIANFFSFFTILSNIAAVIALLWAAARFGLRRPRNPTSQALALTLASASTYMILTGIVYNALLRNIPLPQGTTVWWSNEVLHVIGPLFLLVDVLFAPWNRGLGWRAVLAVLGFPVLWVVYTLIRGPLVTNPLNGDPWWYPYPFLDPHSSTTGGYAGVAGYVVGIAVAISLTALGIVWTSRRRAR